MNLRFILGRAGTGKTHYILNSIKHSLTVSPDGAPIILLVPEQATFQAEYSLTAEMNLCGTIRAQVLSFRRLAHRVLLETGGAARVPIGELGKRMVFRQLLDKNQDNLKIFGKSACRSGFSDTLARSIGELKTYQITPDNLDMVSLGLDNENLLKDKLTDISLLYRQFEDYLLPHYTDPDDYLSLMAEGILKSEHFKDCEIWIDGFKGFTPQEFAVIKNMLLTASRVNLALCIEPACLARKIEEDHVFYPVWETYQKVLKIAEGIAVNIQNPVVLDAAPPVRFQKTPDIAYLEKEFFNYPATVFSGASKNVKLIAGANRRAEVEACAREILRLARDEGYRWQEIVLVLRDLESYHEVIKTIFRDYEIPTFIDLKRNVMHHPLIELIRSALEVVSKEWAYQPVFRYLKTDLVQIEREKVYLLENYVLAHGIRGTKWKDMTGWSYKRRYTLGEDKEVSELEKEELRLINEARKAATCELVGFENKILASQSVVQMATSVYELLTELGVPDTLERWSKEAQGSGNLDLAGEHTQIWKSVMNLLDEVAVALGDEKITAGTFLGILEAGFESMTIGLIPRGLSQVVVGSLDRSRNPDVKVCFILGAGEGIMPARITGDGIFNDTERTKLDEMGINLAPGSRRKVFEEQYLIYTALTRASERLWISYPVADDDGRSASPSPVVGRIKELLPQLSECTYQVEPVTGTEPEGLEFIVHPNRSLTYLAGWLREAKAGRTVSQIWWELYNWYQNNNQDEKVQPVMQSIMQSVFHANSETNIGQQSSLALYGSPIRASVSRIERFRACPFAYFSAYGLKLKERPVYRLAAPDMGEFFHAALKCFAEQLQKESLDWGSVSRDDCLRISDKVVQELVPQLQNEILLSTARYRYLSGKLKKTINRAVLTLAEHASRSEFRPVGLELSFGPGGQLPPVKVKLPNGTYLELSGRIDRLDLAQTALGAYLRIIDYKSSDQIVTIQDMFDGLKLQLLTYLDVALCHYSGILGQEVKPGGILYFTVKQPLISGKGPLPAELLEKKILSKLKMKGFLLADSEVFKMMDNRTQSGYSELFPIGIKTDGSFYSTSAVLDEQQFGLLRQHLNNIFVETGAEILAGKTGIEPYRNKINTACQYCAFKSVCKFDNLLIENRYRCLPAVTQAEIWAAISGKGLNQHV